MSLTKNKYDEKLKDISKENINNSQNNIYRYNKEFKEFEEDGDVQEIYEDLYDIEHDNYLNDLNKRDKFL